MKQFKDTICKKENGATIITLNRPDRLTAITRAMSLRLLEIARSQRETAHAFLKRKTTVFEGI